MFLTGDHRDALTSRQSIVLSRKLPKRISPPSTTKRRTEFSTTSDSEQSLAMTIPVNKSNRRWKAMTKAEECSQDSLSD